MFAHYTHERNWGCRITEAIYRGLRTVTLENELLRVTLLADKGAGVIELLHKPTDTDFMWRSPLGVRNPATFVPTSARPEGSFLDYYEGGWHECFPSGGNGTKHQGMSFGPHGEVCLIPWQYSILQDDPACAQVRFSVRTYRTPFYLEKTVTLQRGSAVASFAERVVNEGATAQSFVWGHHPALGPGFLDDSCVIDLPGATVRTVSAAPTSRCRMGEGFTWPWAPGREGGMVDLTRVPGPEACLRDLAILSDLAGGWYAITNTRRRVGFAMVWSLETFKALWYWQVFGGALEAPWYGRPYCLALEPWSTPQMDVCAAMEHGTELTLGPGEARTSDLQALAYTGLTRVTAIHPDGRVEGTAGERP
jgi:hypothetical protein